MHRPSTGSSTHTWFLSGLDYSYTVYLQHRFCGAPLRKVDNRTRGKLALNDPEDCVCVLLEAAGFFVCGDIEGTKEFLNEIMEGSSGTRKRRGKN